MADDIKVKFIRQIEKIDLPKKPQVQGKVRELVMAVLTKKLK